MIVAAVAFGLQLCCCNLETIFRACVSCGDHSAAAAEDDHHHHDVDGHHDYEHSDLPAGHHDLPDGGDHQHDGDCSCGSHELSKSLPEKSRFEFPALTLIAILPGLGFDDAGSARRACPRPRIQGVFLPPASLLHQHCAHTI